MIIDNTHNSYQYRIITFGEMRRGPYSCSSTVLVFLEHSSTPTTILQPPSPPPGLYVYGNIHGNILRNIWSQLTKTWNLHNLAIPWLIASWIMDFNPVLPLTIPRALFNLVSASNGNASFDWQSGLWNGKKFTALHCTCQAEHPFISNTKHGFIRNSQDYVYGKSVLWYVAKIKHYLKRGNKLHKVKY